MPRHSRWRKGPIHLPLGSEVQAVIIPLQFLRQPRTIPYIQLPRGVNNALKRLNLLLHLLLPFCVLQPLR